MTNDLFPYFEWLTQGQLGQLFGVSSHKIGQWLGEVRLRNPYRQPTLKAVQEGFVKTVCTENGPRFPSWHQEKTVRLFEMAGHKRLSSDDGAMAEPERPPIGPFVAKKSSEDGEGYELVGSDGTVAVWCRGERLSECLASLLTIAARHDKLT